MGRFDLSDDEWDVIRPLLPNGTRGPLRKEGDDRRILNAIFYILRTGAPWADLPERYGSHKTAYNRYNRWAKRGIWGVFSRHWPPRVKIVFCLLIVRLSKRTAPVPEPLKKGSIGRTYRQLTRRSVE